MESECISNHALLASTGECMKLIEIVMKGIRVEEERSIIYHQMKSGSLFEKGFVLLLWN